MAKPLSLTVTLETVTPLFLGGANPRGAPELRAPSVRGALRYWLRAALGGVIGDSNLAGLRTLEQAVFGSSDYGSSISVQLREGARRLRDQREFILPHKRSGQRNAYASGQTFELALCQPRGDDPIVWNMACVSLSLAITFGGIGLRSRRGYGTLRVVDASPPILAKSPSTLASWKAHVEQVAAKAVTAGRDLARLHNVPFASLPKGPAAYPCATRVGMLKICDLEVPSAMDAIVHFMNKVPRNVALGGIQPRQSSPLWVRPIQLDDQYGLLFVVLASSFNGADYKFVKTFLDDFPGDDIQVKGWNV